jgi:hypothetical protein
MRIYVPSGSNFISKNFMKQWITKQTTCPRLRISDVKCVAVNWGGLENRDCQSERTDRKGAPQRSAPISLT